MAIYEIDGEIRYRFRHEVEADSLEEARAWAKEELTSSEVRGCCADAEDVDIDDVREIPSG